MCSDRTLAKERSLLRRDSVHSPKAIVAIAPHFDHYEWHWAREEFYANTFALGSPSIKGAGVDNSGVYCAWNRSFGETPEHNTLYILRWVYDEPTSPSKKESIINAMVAILQRARLEAHEWNMKTIEFWNPSAFLMEAVGLVDASASLEHREESSVCCLKWNGSEEGLGNDVEWRWNEKYAWC